MNGGRQGRIPCASRSVFGTLTLCVFSVGVHRVQRNIQAHAKRLRMRRKVIRCGLETMVNMNGMHLTGELLGA